MKKIQLLLVSVIALLPLTAAGERVDLTWRLQARNLLVQAKHASKAWFRDREVQYRLRLWLNAEVNRAYVQECEQQLGSYFHSYNTLAALCWSKRQNDATHIRQLLTYYYLDLAMSLLELSNDPRYEKKFQRIASGYLRHFKNYPRELEKLTACFARRELYDIAACLEQDFTLVRHPRHHLRRSRDPSRRVAAAQGADRHLPDPRLDPGVGPAHGDTQRRPGGRLHPDRDRPVHPRERPQPTSDH